MELADSKYDVFDVPSALVYADERFNCRASVSRMSIEELAESIKNEGLLLPVIVQPAEDVEDGIPDGYEFRLVCGFRRFFAVTKLLGHDTIPANVRHGLTAFQAALINFQENLERKNLSLLEEARTIDRLYPPSYAPTRIARELKRDVAWVRLRRKVLELPEWIQTAIEADRFSEREVKAIVQSGNPDWKAEQILDTVRTGRSSYRLKGRRIKSKAEVKHQMAKLLEEGFSIYVLRLLGWCIGEVDDNQLKEALCWLRDRKGWLK